MGWATVSRPFCHPHTTDCVVWCGGVEWGGVVISDRAGWGGLQDDEATALWGVLGEPERAVAWEHLAERGAAAWEAALHGHCRGCRR